MTCLTAWKFQKYEDGWYWVLDRKDGRYLGDVVGDERGWTAYPRFGASQFFRTRNKAAQCVMDSRP